MRLWSLHPRYLDVKGLLALWREGLLARKVLRGETRGYRHHPQLQRFRQTDDPARSIDAYLWSVVREAQARGYRFDASKLDPNASVIMLPCLEVTEGQLRYEFAHLLNKLEVRHPAGYAQWREVTDINPHPLLIVVPGPVADWEKV